MQPFKIKRFLQFGRSFSLHAVFIGSVLYFVFPILTLYWNQKPAVGIDLFLSVNFVTYLQHHLTWPFLSWKYIWFDGTPTTQTYPLLHFYLIQPLLRWFSAVRAVEIYALFSMVLFFIFSYLLFYSLSRSRGLAVVLSVATAYSYNIWSALYWAGSIPYIATIFLLPLSLYLVIQAFEKENKKYIYFAGLLSGLFIMGHPQSFISYTVPFTALLIIFFGSNKIKMFKWEKFGTMFVYGMIMFLVGFPQAGVGFGVISQFFKVLGGAFTEGAAEFADTTYATAAGETAGSPILRLFDIYRRSNPLFFWGLGIGFVSAFLTTFLAFLIRGKVSYQLKILVPFVLMGLYLFLFLYAFVLGINPITGGWFRAFWPSMTIFGGLIAVFWRVSANNLEILAGNLKDRVPFFKWGSWIVGGISGGIVLYVGIAYLQTTYLAFQKDTLSYVSESSAFPTVISLNLEKGEWPEKLPKLVPNWLDANDLNYRLYDMDATVNIWWSSVFKMPLARGYLDASPGGESGENVAGWQYWRNVTFSKDEIVDVWKVPKEMAINQAKFLLDWGAIGYMEGAPVYGRNYASLPSTYIRDNPDIVKKTESVFTLRPAKYFQIEGRGWDIPDTQQELKYFEINKDVVSPIYNATNAPSILVVGDAIGQDTIMRNVASLGLDSKKVIIVQWNKNADSLSESDLKNFDVVFLYRYKYKNARKVFKRLENFVKGGGKLFIETGTEQVESNASSLPAIFPFDSQERKPLGRAWDFKMGDNNITKGINFNIFSEPIFDGNEWNFSYPTDSLRSGANVLIYNHGKPVLIEYALGGGKVIWSGMNFPGHVQGNRNIEELKLFKNILFELQDFSQNKNLKVSFERPTSETVIIKGSGAKAILFKESAYAGWGLTVKAEGKSRSLPIYESGPMVHGYMYAVLPDEMKNKPFIAEFKYHGEMVYKFNYFISFVATFLVFDYIFLGKKFSALLKRSYAFLHRGAGKWWEREDEI